MDVYSVSWCLLHGVTDYTDLMICPTNYVQELCREANRVPTSTCVLLWAGMAQSV
jgi:hypothetical protein